ncbi:unnamed protein product [Cylindrotheca closterium]|uniref:Uncharacterized protein n=1 Tax=Cylindrotheca closterium TaxID=2856 RepID=A0AAD2FF55_9STRA|nr:unnamed protein product [Cylindrotheca closterium]
MPTKIILDKKDDEEALTPVHENINRRRSFRSNRNRAASPDNVTSVDQTKRIVNFRASIFREELASQPIQTGLSSTDIRASPRLIGYLYQLLACIVLSITAIKFDQNSQNETLFSLGWDYIFATDARIYQSIKGPVYYWKVIGSAIVGAVGGGISLLVVLAHIDTIFLPKTWYKVFRDGSMFECYLLRFLLIFYTAALHVSTSSLSVGQIEPNVFFTSWIAFAASVMNLGVWRGSAGFDSIAEKISVHERATTFNWVWSFFFVLTFAASATDIFFNRSEVTISHKGVVLSLSDKEWYNVLGFCWFFVFVCIVALLFNQFLHTSCELRVFGGSRVILGWRQSEGIIIFFMVGVFFWIVYDYTGVDAVLNGLPNAYFSVWGCFFNSIFLLGTWLRENKNIEYIVARDPSRSNHIYDA